jgi:hypothetical protein
MPFVQAQRVEILDTSTNPDWLGESTLNFHYPGSQSDGLLSFELKFDGDAVGGFVIGEGLLIHEGQEIPLSFEDVRETRLDRNSVSLNGIRPSGLDLTIGFDLDDARFDLMRMMMSQLARHFRWNYTTD